MRLHHRTSSLRALALLASVCLFQAVTRTTAHSWLECTDYRIDPNSDDAKFWNPSHCYGRARCGGTQMNSKFGLDTGLNEHSTKCQCARDSPKNDAPVAQYTPGQRVCLAYPPKNHVAAPCTNAFIPDAGVRITRSGVNPTSDDATGTEYKQNNGEHKSGVIDYKGFQNCPNFCNNMDGALCTMCFDLESDLAPGTYSFKWIWAFNDIHDVYTTCWEAKVGGSGGGNSAPTSPLDAGPMSQPVAPAVQQPSNSSNSSTTPLVAPAVGNPVHAQATGKDDDCVDELGMPGDDCDDELAMPDDDKVGGEGDMSAVAVNQNLHDDGEDCDDELGMPGADCDDDLELAGGGEVGGEADPSASAVNQNGNKNAYGGGGEGGGAPAMQKTEAGAGSPTQKYPSQHGYHHKWHHGKRGKRGKHSKDGNGNGNGYGNGHQPPSNNSQPQQPSNNSQPQQPSNNSQVPPVTQDEPVTITPVSPPSAGQSNNTEPNTDSYNNSTDNIITDGGDDDDSDCALPIANVAPEAAAAVVETGKDSDSGKPAAPAANGLDPECDEKLPYNYDNKPEAAEAQPPTNTNGQQGGSYTFGQQPVDSGKKSDNAAGNVKANPDAY